jgi:riboflavin synthase
MFSGIVTNIATVSNVFYRHDLRNKLDFDITIELPVASILPRYLNRLENGCSIACNGICLTLTAYKIYRKTSFLPNSISKNNQEAEFVSFNFTASAETIAKTTIGDWHLGRAINLEFAIAAGEEFGGHFVSGHIDCVSRVDGIKTSGDCWAVTFTIPKIIASSIVNKGSVTIDGVSLTVNNIYSISEDYFFEVMIIPYTLQNSNLSSLKIGDFCNIEADLIAKLIAKQIANFLPQKPL